MKATILDQLTAPMITPDLLRVRASYWRIVADRHVRARRLAQADRLRINCEAMERQALEMETAPVTSIVPRAAKAKAAPRSSGIGASRFWDLHGQAVASIRLHYGPNWHCAAPRDMTIAVSLPPSLRSCIGPLGGKIRWGRDHRMPAAMFWPNGTLPDGLIVAPPSPPPRPAHPLALGIERDNPMYAAMLEAHRQAWGLIDAGDGVLITDIEHNRAMAIIDQRELDDRVSAERYLDKLARDRRDAENRREFDMRREADRIEANLDFDRENGRIAA